MLIRLKRVLAKFGLMIQGWRLDLPKEASTAEQFDLML
jgi:hypothetical protein